MSPKLKISSFVIKVSVIAWIPVGKVKQFSCSDSKKSNQSAADACLD